MKTYKIKSYCKINLNLRVIKKLNNGYHQLQSLVTFCKLYDLILLKELSVKKDVVYFTGKFKNKISKRHNTIYKTLNELKKNNKIKKKFFEIVVRKNIPHGSGLGSASANSATLINFFNKQFKLRISKKKIKKIAKKIGSDVQLSLDYKNSFITGKYNQILRIKRKFKLNLLIVYPNILCQTKKIFSKKIKFNQLMFLKLKSINTHNDLINFLKKEKNDLQPIVFKYFPEVKTLCEKIALQKGCYFSRITGSGSACIGIFSTINYAKLAKKNLCRTYPKYWYETSKTI